MEKLLTQYSFSEIFLILITIALFIKGCVDFFDWCGSRIKKHTNKEIASFEEKNHVEENLKQHEEDIQKIIKNQDKTNEELKCILDNIKTLMESDRDSIKADITKQHHYFCYTKGWIDDYSLDCIEKRYAHYKKMGGNSYIHDLMEELRELKKLPPK